MDIVFVLHSLGRWLVLLFGIWAILAAIGGLSSKRNYSKTDNSVSLLFMIFMDLQVLAGFILFFTNSWFDNLKHMGDYMKDPLLRFFTLEHWLLMLIAWVLVHVGRTSSKKSVGSRRKFRKTLIFFGIAMLLILLAIPWPFREAVARPWFRWF